MPRERKLRSGCKPSEAQELAIRALRSLRALRRPSALHLGKLAKASEEHRRYQASVGRKRVIDTKPASTASVSVPGELS